MRVTNGFCAIFLLLSGVVAADCPPLKTPPGFVANGAPEHKGLRSRRAAQYQRSRGRWLCKSRGRVLSAGYRVADGGATRMPAVETAYRAQLDALGANDVFQSNGDHRTDFRGDGPGSRFTVSSAKSRSSSSRSSGLKLVLTAASGYDYRLVGHMPNYVAAKPEIDENGHFDFHVEDPAGDRRYSGPAVARSTSPITLTDGATSASDAEVAFNYRSRFERSARSFCRARTIRRPSRASTRTGRAIWFRVYNQPGEISVHVLEEKPVQTPVATPALKQTLIATVA